MSSIMLTVDDDADPLVLAIRGSLDAASLETLAPVVTRLLALRPERLIVDLAGLTFVSSLGIGQILMLCGHVGLRGGGAVIVASHPDVHEAFLRCRAEDVATLCRTTDEAAQLFAAFFVGAQAG